nr:microphthalmia-associated transcription factor [Quercus suber]
MLARAITQTSASPIKLTFTLLATDQLTVFPPFGSISGYSDKNDSVLDLDFAPRTTFDHDTMASSPCIKSEPNDYGQFDPNTFMTYGDEHNQNQHHFNSNGNGPGNMNINPANLSNGSNMSQNFGQNNMSSSFIMGNSGIADDELIDLELNQSQQPNNNNLNFNQGMHNFYPPQHNNAFSHTPDAPIHSPFSGSNNMTAFRQYGGHSMPQPNGVYRTHMHRLDRTISDSRSPATPNTPAMNHMQVGDDLSRPGMLRIQHQRQSSSVGGAGWESTPSGHSWNDNSPFPSPNGHPVHVGISEVLKNNNASNNLGDSSAHSHKVVSSLPAKMEGGTAAPIPPPYQSPEAKRRRRRESHNLVERRRRDNINERIQDLGGLVPQHRLEDEKVRKHLQTNSPLSPAIANASGMSPPTASSLFANGQGRRAAGSGNITQGLPMEEKDKGPNKGDILNGSVAWTRDLMWYTHLKLQQEQELKDYVASLGGSWPFQQDDVERRMHSEICEILNKHAPLGGFTAYSRAPGSGLRVPGYTNVAGDSVNGEDNHGANGSSDYLQQQQATSPGFQSGGSGMSSGQMHHQTHFWDGGNFKEEDEYVHFSSEEFTERQHIPVRRSVPNTTQTLGSACKHDQLAFMEQRRLVTRHFTKIPRTSCAALFTFLAGASGLNLLRARLRRDSSWESNVEHEKHYMLGSLLEE